MRLEIVCQSCAKCGVLFVDDSVVDDSATSTMLVRRRGGIAMVGRAVCHYQAHSMIVGRWAVSHIEASSSAAEEDDWYCRGRHRSEDSE